MKGEILPVTRWQELVGVFFYCLHVFNPALLNTLTGAFIFFLHSFSSSRSVKNEDINFKGGLRGRS